MNLITMCASIKRGIEFIGTQPFSIITIDLLSGLPAETM